MPPPSDATQSIELHLQDIRDLFQPPEPDLLTGQFHDSSGMERLHEKLQESPKRGTKAPPRLVLHLPGTAVPEGLEPRVQDAIARYCALRIDIAQQRLNAMRRERNQSLLMGSLFLAACLLLAAFLETTPVLPDFWQGLVRESVVIAGWVGLWHPMELTLYAWWPFRQEIRTYRQIREMPVTLRPAP